MSILSWDPTDPVPHLSCNCTQVVSAIINSGHDGHREGIMGAANFGAKEPALSYTVCSSLFFSV